MIVYVESNFVLELALDQEEHGGCEEILGLAAAKRIELVLPAYCIGEPYETLVRRRNQRRDLHQRLTQELRELGRSSVYADAVKELSGLTGLLVESGEKDLSRLNSVLQRLIGVATLVPIDRTILDAALHSQARLGLSPQDSIVYASVRSRLIGEDGPQCFVNKNASDFLIPEIEKEFAARGCKLLGRFEAALGYMRGILAHET